MLYLKIDKDGYVIAARYSLLDIIHIILLHLSIHTIMVNYLREIVSGKKARFIDHETNLDLVYVTDRILM